MFVTQERLDATTSTIDEILEKNYCAPKDAQKLHGLLNFIFSVHQSVNNN